MIANNRNIEEIRNEIGCDSLRYLDLNLLKNIMETNQLCTGCFTNNYPIDIEDVCL